MAMRAIDELSHYFETGPEWECVGRGFNHALALSHGLDFIDFNLRRARAENAYKLTNQIILSSELIHDLRSVPAHFRSGEELISLHKHTRERTLPYEVKLDEADYPHDDHHFVSTLRILELPKSNLEKVIAELTDICNKMKSLWDPYVYGPADIDYGPDPLFSQSRADQLALWDFQKAKFHYDRLKQMLPVAEDILKESQQLDSPLAMPQISTSWERALFIDVGTIYLLNTTTDGDKNTCLGELLRSEGLNVEQINVATNRLPYGGRWPAPPSPGSWTNDYWPLHGATDEITKTATRMRTLVCRADN